MEDSEARPGQPYEKSERQLTRELELLISAALVFALLQLPGVLDRWWDGIGAHVTGTPFGVAFSAYYAGKLASYGLIVAILTHFLLRGFWVALMGLRSAYPGGIDPSRLHQGPLMRGFLEGRLLDLEQLEARVDRTAAVIFAFIFMFLSVLLGIIVFALLALAIALVARWITGREDATAIAFWSVFALLIITQSFVATADAWSKKRELPRPVRSVAEAIFKATHYTLLGALHAPIFFTFSTRISRRIISTVQTVFFLVLIAAFAISTFSSVGLIGFDSYAWFPPAPADAHVLRNSHYEDQRNADDRSVVPTIQSQMIADPYVKLFVPYNVRRDNPQILRLCPGVTPFRSEGLFVRTPRKSDPAQIDATLACFERIYAVELDGKPIKAVDTWFYVHPESRIHGRLSMIPAADLRPGRHEILVRRETIPGQASSRAPSEFTIPFWK